MMRGLEYPYRIEYTIDGERVHLATIGGNTDLAAAFEKPTATGDAMEARLRVRLPVKAVLTWSASRSSRICRPRWRTSP